MFWSTSELRVRLAPWNWFKPWSKSNFTDRSKAVLLFWIVSVSNASCWCVCCYVVSVLCSLVVTCCERADLLAVMCVFFLSLSQMCPGPHQNQGRCWCLETGLSPPVKKKLLTFPRRHIFCGSFFFCLVFVLPLCTSVCFLPCGHLLGKGWPLGSSLWCLIVSLSLSHWYPGSGVVLDCIDSWSLHSYLLLSKNRIPILRDLPKYIIQYLVMAWQNKYIFTFPKQLDAMSNA